MDHLQCIFVLKFERNLTQLLLQEYPLLFFLLALVLLLVLAYQIYAVCRQSSALLGTELSSSAARGWRAAKGRERKKEKYGRTKRDDAQASTGLVCSDEENAVLRDEDDEQEL